jgi:hypothetical protein
MHKSAPMQWFSVKAAARERKCLLRRLRSFLAFDIVQNNVRLYIHTREDFKIHMEKWSAVC